MVLKMSFLRIYMLGT